MNEWPPWLMLNWAGIIFAESVIALEPEFLRKIAHAYKRQLQPTCVKAWIIARGSVETGTLVR
jgi:hypothetical protein